MSNSYKDLQNSHPCFGGHKNNAGRIHLPVSPGCNIACRFCDRTINDVENRPGVTSKILKPDECEDILKKALDICPEIKVVGIAGPGDTLASDYALETFKIVKNKFPDLIKCMSTNGLLLNERAEEVINVGIDSLTVTVNAVDPEIESKLNAYIIYHGKKIEGVEGARILIENQLEGICKVAAAGITIKVNTVLVPEINGDFVAAIAALREKVLSKEKDIFFVDQTANPANPGIHEATTGPEIWDDTDGDVDILVANVGTGGTVSGTGKYLKSKKPELKVVAIQPGENSLPSDENPAPEEITGVHPFEGVPQERVPSTMDLNIYDEKFEVETIQAYKAAREVAKTDGILVGTSSGAAIYAATELAKRPENKGKTIVAVLPDTGLRYLSTNLFNEEFQG